VFFYYKDMNEDKVFLTKQGLEDLKKEYELLNGAKKAEAIDRVAATRVVGELVENGDYTQAKQDLAYIEGRLQELEDVLGRATIIQDNCIDRNKVGLGCKVTVKTDSKKVAFHLVGEWEADPLRQKISHESPLGQALIGKKIGEKVEIDAPAGKLTYTILSIE
jgi:transcription elongation factor GreA